jgi:hypothetical protein
MWQKGNGSIYTSCGGYKVRGCGVRHYAMRRGHVLTEEVWKKLDEAELC